MKPFKRNYRVNWVILVTTLLLLGGLAAAQNPNPKAWAREVNGLQISIYLDQAEGGQSKVPKFRVELRNVGPNDLLLNLGIMTRHGRQQYPTAVSLIFVDAQGKSQRLEPKSPVEVSDAGKETLFLPLPIGATFSIPVDLDDYWAVASKEFDSRLKPGTYWLAAQFTGFNQTDNHVILAAQGPVLAEPPILARTFDMVNPEAGGPPTSNTLQFDVPTR